VSLRGAACLAVAQRAKAERDEAIHSVSFAVEGRGEGDPSRIRVGSRRAKLGLSCPSPLWGRDERSSLLGGAKRRVGVAHCHAPIPRLRSTPTRQSFAPLTMCLPSPQVGGMNTTDAVVARAMTSRIIHPHLRILAA
jgi:hypothetical protein